MNPNFSVVIVLYNRSLEDSTSVRSIKNLAFSIPFELFIWDNSLDAINSDNLNGLEAIVGPFHYIHTPENISLAVIYNEVSSKIREDDFLVIFDQDSDFDANLFLKASNAIRDNPDIDLFVPYVKLHGIIFSPGDHNYIKGKYWKNLQIGRVIANNKVAISSGMIIRNKYLIKFLPTFDNRLKLYGIDSDFVLAYGKRNEFFFVLDYNLGHHLSVNERESLEVKLFRFRDMCVATLIISKKKSWGHYLASYMYIIYLSIKFGIQYRSLKFLKV